MRFEYLNQRPNCITPSSTHHKQQHQEQTQHCHQPQECSSSPCGKTISSREDDNNGYDKTTTTTTENSNMAVSTATTIALSIYHNSSSSSSTTVLSQTNIQWGKLAANRKGCGARGTTPVKKRGLDKKFSFDNKKKAKVLKKHNPNRRSRKEQEQPPPQQQRVLMPDITVVTQATSAAAVDNTNNGSNSNFVEVWDPVYQRVLSHPDEIRRQDPVKGNNPMHSACRRNPPTILMEAMLVHDQKAIATKEVFASEPLSTFALPSFASASFLSPPVAAALQQNVKGQTPLHVACRYGVAEPVQALLAKACPQAISVKDQKGNLPLHYAARRGVSYKLMSSLLEQHHHKAAAAAVSSPICDRNARQQTPLDALPRSYVHAQCLDDILDGNDDDYSQVMDGSFQEDWNLLALFLWWFSYHHYQQQHQQQKDSTNTTSIISKDELLPPPPLPQPPTVNCLLDESNADNYQRWIIETAAAFPEFPKEIEQFLLRVIAVPSS